MQYCVDYYPISSFKHYDEVAELTIVYRKADTSLPTFLEQHAKQTIILKEIESFDTEDFDRFVLLNEKYHNIKLRLYASSTWAIQEAQKRQVPFFIALYARNWEMFYGLLELNPTDIYITNPLTFSLDKVAEAAHSRHIRVRAMPNVAQCDWLNIPVAKKFFISPNHINVYDKYIDVCEFAACNELNTIYEIYMDKDWFGDLREIINNINEPLDNRNLFANFAERRATCGKKCYTGYPCRICDQFTELSKTISNTNAFLR